MVFLMLFLLMCAIFASTIVRADSENSKKKSNSLQIQEKVKIVWAKLQGVQLAKIKFSANAPDSLKTGLRITPEIPIKSVSIEGNLLKVHTSSPFRLDAHYFIHLPGRKKRFLQPDSILDGLYSNKPLGFHRDGHNLAFRVFAPRAKWVRLVLFDAYHHERGREFKMARDDVGVWEFFTNQEWTGKYYGYRVHGPQGYGEMFDSTIVVADPYSEAVVSKNHYTHPEKTIIIANQTSSFDPDRGVAIHPRDLIIYEMHVRDLTAHPSSGVAKNRRGTYLGLIEENQKGGIAHIKKLGVNAVELLPVQDFSNIEIPYLDSTIAGYPTNTWNPYERNHWGYMTSNFFAPESYYATGGTMARGKLNGADARQVRELKQMVRAFHKNEIAVIMDVVYNHVSQYNYNSFKYLDKFYYFRVKPNGDFEGTSGTGNDFKTERSMARRMIVESVLYWMEEYNIDGFRFDLAAMLDWQTIDVIREAAQRINPNVILIAEPWGGGKYAPAEFSDHSWAAWNDQFRNGFKGWNPLNDAGFIFGKRKHGTKPKDLRNYVMGTLQEYGGLFVNPRHSVNYLESHDDHTLGDFIRLALGDVTEDERIADLDGHAKLTANQLKINKLAALALLTSQGAVMIHEGQAYARSKVIAKTDAPDPRVGMIDHNSYEKDNETNWLNFTHAEMNAELVNYYRDLIALRKTYSAFRHADPENFEFFETNDSFFLAYQINFPGQTFLVALNGNRQKNHRLTLPTGEWTLLADGNAVYLDSPKLLKKMTVNVPASTGAILKRIR